MSTAYHAPPPPQPYDVHGACGNHPATSYSVMHQAAAMSRRTVPDTVRSGTYFHPRGIAYYDPPPVQTSPAQRAQASIGHQEPVRFQDTRARATRVQSPRLYDRSAPVVSAGPSYSTATALRPASQSGAKREEDAPRPSELLIHSSFMIPECIDPNQGSIADFAAEMTCLFWFESMEVLQAAGEVRHRPSSDLVPPLSKYAIPDASYKKWVSGVLSTTQVTQNVILLALLFIYRLKKLNPTVRGRPGSEYRLLTVALMLGNKFLDDNTYTNKTWAEVSCIKVQEVHVMEVEFLSNMRYSLLVTANQWDVWLVKLADFARYCARAGEKPAKQPSPLLAVPSPTRNLHKSPPLAAPMSTSQASHSAGLVTATTGYAADSTLMSHPTGRHSHMLSSPLAMDYMSITKNSRKRSADEDPVDRPTKRAAQPVQAVQAMPSAGRLVNSSHGQPMRFPVPKLTLVTNSGTHSAPQQPPQQQQQQQQQQLHPHSNSQSNPLLFVPSGKFVPMPQVSLPPLTSGMRAMATACAPTSLGQQHPISVTSSTPTKSSYPPGVGDGPPLMYRTPTKHHGSNGRGTFASSPADTYPPGSSMHVRGIHNPALNSPSIYLQDRRSPYKPVREVNALLYPPASIHEYHHPIPAQMHYQPIGRRNEFRSGVVPEFIMTPGHTTQLHGSHAQGSRGRTLY